MAKAIPDKRPAVKVAQQKSAPAKKNASAANEKETLTAIAARVPEKTAKPAGKAKPAVVKADADAKEKPKKPKLVRDSFTMPEAEYAVLGDVKKACLKAGIEVKKSELLRVGVALLREMDTAKLKVVLDTLPALKAGRPKKGK
ncbi:MAG TPA: hypothetical protein VEC01_13615 [Noviherbaspirillum sp.]|uniref:hypothetical protein n=1 Tax=Noviherbaspirillum sp. TaxID=1926288 RepID=UPI002D3BE2F4|nr:hypothetical protein [Noviherbaspirillum sp.]HYD96361.1 hypothetical protein [Noviherbaspirillum sp.]